MKPDKCASGSAEEKAVGKITGGTATYTKKGETFTAFVCVSKTGALSLAPKTKATFESPATKRCLRAAFADRDQNQFYLFTVPSCLGSRPFCWIRRRPLLSQAVSRPGQPPAQERPVVKDIDGGVNWIP